MIGQQYCPPPHVLAELIDGKLPEPELSEFSRHLEGCAACQAVARTLSPSDTLIESLRGESTVSERIARLAPHALIERLKQIPRGDSPVAAELDLSFLAPAQQADE